jgi:hypothetical protein
MDTVRGIENDDEAISLIRSAVSHVTKDLIQSLLNRKPWKETAAIVRSLTDDAEKIRMGVQGYVAAILVNGKKDDMAALILEEFLRLPSFSGKSGITYACYMLSNLPQK